MKRIVTSIVAGGAIIAAVVAHGQKSFPKAVFEFGLFRSYSGTLYDWPAPILIAGAKQYLLVGMGKHGVQPFVKQASGKAASFSGALIERDGVQMLEIAPDSLQVQPSQQPSAIGVRSLGMVELTGEVVDTKCYLGVMNPGQGKVHRGCAARCISGGIPPALAMDGRIVLLIGSDDRQLGRELLPFAGERVRAKGELIQAGDIQALRTEPNWFSRQ
jgi:hypothetical protein